MESEIQILRERVIRIEEILTWLQVELDDKMLLVRELLSTQINVKKSMISYGESVCQRLASKRTLKAKVTKRPHERTSYSPITPPATTHAVGAFPPNSLPFSGPPQYWHNATERMPGGTSSHLYTQVPQPDMTQTSHVQRTSNQINYIARPGIQHRPHTLQIDNGNSSGNIRRAGSAGDEMGTRELQHFNNSSLPESSSRGGIVFYRDTTTTGTENMVKIPSTNLQVSTTSTGHLSVPSLDTLRRRHTFPLQTEIPMTSSQNTILPNPINNALRDHLIQKAANGSIQVDVPTSCACDICGREFVNIGILNHHKSNVHERKNMNTCKPLEWKCPICHKHLSINSKLKHLRIHGSRKYECSVCAIQFNKESELNAHMKIHPPGAEKSFSEIYHKAVVDLLDQTENLDQHEQKRTEENNSDQTGSPEKFQGSSPEEPK